MFHILKYIRPTWYFNLQPAKDHGYFKLSDSASGIDFNERDTAYLSLINGQIEIDAEDDGQWWKLPPVSVKDEYTFAFRHFNKARVLYAFCLRILMMNNPFPELKGLLLSRKERLSRHDGQRTANAGFGNFESHMIRTAPLVTVIIPTLNRYSYLKDVLHDLELQRYQNFEVIITDQSSPFQPDFYKNFNLNIRVIHQKEKALWMARNESVKISNGNFLLFFDDDSRVDRNWIMNHLKCIDFYRADISSGVSISVSGGAVPDGYSYFRWSDQLDTGNVMIRKEVFRTVGLFDRNFEKQRMGDGEFGLRCYLAGLRNISNPLAKRLHLKVGEGGLRESGGWDAFRPRKVTDLRPMPSVLYYIRKYFGNKAAYISLLIHIPPGLIPYRFKKSRVLMIFGFMLCILLAPFVLIQIIRSWRLSSEMLRNPGVEAYA
jgi:glycosyltransferase involved in cell wall biosynthesis